MKAPDLLRIFYFLSLLLSVLTPSLAHSQSSSSIAPEDIQYCPAPPAIAPAAESGDQVWSVGNHRWNDEYEVKYAEWLKQDVKTDFLVQYGLRADCADFAAITRAVFARINRLPILYRSESNQELGHFSTEFKRLPTIEDWDESNWRENLLKDRRFRAFLARIPDTITVHGIDRNAHPIEVYDPQDPKRVSRYFRPGVIESSGTHVKVISDIDPHRWFAIRQLSATTPASIQKLTEYTAELAERKKPGEGVLAWNWPILCGDKAWQHVPNERMPGYSLQQYEFKIPEEKRRSGMHLGYYLETIARDPALKIPPRATIQQEVAALTGFIQTRVPIVKNGHELAKSAEAKQNPTLFQENYSTPNFDLGTARRMRIIENIIHRYGPRLQLTEADLVRISDSMPIDIGEADLKTTAYFFVQAVRDKSVSSNPEDDLEARWGIAYMRTLMEKLPSELRQLEATRSQVATRKQYNQQKVVELSQPMTLIARVGQYFGYDWRDPRVIQEMEKYRSWYDYDDTQYAAADSKYELRKAELSSLRKLLPPAAGPSVSGKALP